MHNYVKYIADYQSYNNYNTRYYCFFVLSDIALWYFILKPRVITAFKLV